MIVNEFEKLNEEEKELLFETPAYVAVLLAGSDGKIDQQEEIWASKVMDFRKSIGEERLHLYYELADRRYRPTFLKLVDQYLETESRNEALSDALAARSMVLNKLENDFAQILLHSWRTFAKQVARASGGIWGFGGISKDEKKFVDLDMIQIPHS